jgi:hypothetical protein
LAFGLDLNKGAHTVLQSTKFGFVVFCKYR